MKKVNPLGVFYELGVAQFLNGSPDGQASQRDGKAKGRACNAPPF